MVNNFTCKDITAARTRVVYSTPKFSSATADEVVSTSAIVVVLAGLGTGQRGYGYRIFTL